MNDSGFGFGFTCGTISISVIILFILFINWLAEPEYKELLQISYKSSTSEVNKKLADEILEKNFPNMKYDIKEYNDSGKGFKLKIGTRAK